MSCISKLHRITCSNVHLVDLKIVKVVWDTTIHQMVPTRSSMTNLGFKARIYKYRKISTSSSTNNTMGKNSSAHSSHKAAWRSGFYVWLVMWRSWVRDPLKVPVVSLNKKLYPYCLVLDGTAWYHNRTKINWIKTPKSHNALKSSKEHFLNTGQQRLEIINPGRNDSLN